MSNFLKLTSNKITTDCKLFDVSVGLMSTWFEFITIFFSWWVIRTPLSNQIGSISSPYSFSTGYKRILSIVIIFFFFLLCHLLSGVLNDLIGQLVISYPDLTLKLEMWDLVKFDFEHAQCQRGPKIRHSRPQRLRSIWPVPWIETSGRLQFSVRDTRTSDLSAQSRTFIKTVDQAINFGQGIQNFSDIT